MRPLPAREPDLDRRWVMRVPPDPHVRFDTNDYSLDPNLVGRRVEVRVTQREIIAVAMDTRRAALPGTSGCSRRTGRSPRSSTPGRCASAAASPMTRSSLSSGRYRSMTS